MLHAWDMGQRAAALIAASAPAAPGEPLAAEPAVVVDQATGVVSAQLGCSIAEAVAHLHERSRRQRQTLESVAHQVVDSLNVNPGEPRF